MPNSSLPDYTVPLTLVSISSPSSSDVMAARIVLIGFGCIDNKTNVSMEFIVSNNASSSVDRTVVSLVVDIPHFDEGFSYDPDFSVTLSQTSSSNGGDLLPLLSLIFLVIPLIMTAAVAFVAIAMWFLRVRSLRRTRRDVRASVNIYNCDKTEQL